MRHLKAVLLLTTALLCSGTTWAQDGTLLVVNRQSDAGSVSFFDLQTQIEIARVPIGPGWPHEVAVSPDGSRVYPLPDEGTQAGPVELSDCPGVEAGAGVGSSRRCPGKPWWTVQGSIFQSLKNPKNGGTSMKKLNLPAPIHIRNLRRHPVVADWDPKLSRRNPWARGRPGKA